MSVPGQLWKNRALLMEVLEGIRNIAKGAHTAAEIRKRLADGIQKGDIVSDDALEKFKSANQRAKDYIESGS